MKTRSAKKGKSRKTAAGKGASRSRASVKSRGSKKSGTKKPRSKKRVVKKTRSSSGPGGTKRTAGARKKSGKTSPKKTTAKKTARKTKKKTAKKKTAKKTKKTSAKKTNKTAAKKKTGRKTSRKKPAARRGKGVSPRSAESAALPEAPAAALESLAPGALEAPGRPAAPAALPSSHRTQRPEIAAADDPENLVRMGIDLGTRRTVTASSRRGAPLAVDEDILATVVGLPRPGIFPGALPEGTTVLFSDQALEHREHVDIRRPLEDDVVVDVEACRKLAEHIVSLVDPFGLERIWAVVSVSAEATEEQRDRVRQAMLGALERIRVVPEPCLAVAGLCRDGDLAGVRIDPPLNHALVVDIGSESTHLSRVSMSRLEVTDTLRLDKGGDFIDEEILFAARERYPALRLDRELVRQLKEEQASVLGDLPRFEAGGEEPRPELLDLAAVLRRACDHLLSQVTEGVTSLLSRSDPEVASMLTRSVVVTGGGSRIQGLGARLEETLRAGGYESAGVILPADHRRLVARGALHLAETTSEEAWDRPPAPAVGSGTSSDQSAEHFFSEMVEFGSHVADDGFFRNMFPE